MTFVHVALAINESIVLRDQDDAPIRTFTHQDRKPLRLCVTNEKVFAWFEPKGIDPVEPLKLSDTIRADWFEVLP